LAATGNKYYGYFGGGLANFNNPSIRSSIDRIDYLNDTATALSKGQLGNPLYGLSATGNSDFGYFGSGFFSYSPSNLLRMCNVLITLMTPQRQWLEPTYHLLIIYLKQQQVIRTLVTLVVVLEELHMLQDQE
jgi:hypothetical protein